MNPPFSVDGKALDRGEDRLRAGWRAALFLVGAVGLVGGLLLMQGRPPQVEPRYWIETVSRGQVTGVLHLAGWLEPTATVRVGAENTGRVAAVRAEIGDLVARGQVLARLDIRKQQAEAVGAQAQVLAARVSLRQAQVRLSHIVHLLQRADDGSGPDESDLLQLQSAAMTAESELVNAAAGVRKHSAQVVATQSVLEASLLRAPISGVVTSRVVEPGETVTPGTPLFVIASPPTELRLVTSVGEKDVGRVHGGSVTFTVPSVPKRVFTAVLTAIEPGPRGDAPPFTYRLHLLARNEAFELRPGMTVVVSLPIASSPDALKVPADALRFAPAGALPIHDGAAVYVSDGAGTPARVPVEIGVTDGATVEIRSSRLPAGTPVVVAAR